ncbi:hydroxymethylglutaryl-CoA lyase [Nakamurella silvestris]|nr:hydroxymethylglutaryl-CoA lyase [Nakamurella silvestris]
MNGQALPAAVSIREVGLRDGLQIEEPIPFESKLLLLEAIVATGVPRVEATAFVSPRAVPSMADAEQVAGALGRWPKVAFSGLVASPNGARRAVAAGVVDLEYVISAAPSHSLANVRMTTEAAVTAAEEVIRVAHEAGGRCEVIIATAWDCPFDGRTDPARVTDIARRTAEMGADQLCLGDTIGTTSPLRVVDLVERVRAVAPGLSVGAHFHNTRGTGIANALAAVQAGVTQLDASVGGLGGCPFAPGATGNIATEELLYLLQEMGIVTGMDLDATVTAAALAQELVGHPVPSSLLKAGGRSVPRGPIES